MSERVQTEQPSGFPNILTKIKSSAKAVSMSGATRALFIYI